jgi:dTDP-glucose 4,6-dehydratase
MESTGLPRSVIVTGAAGFIGSNFVNLYAPQYPDTKFIVLDKLTYAGNLLNLSEVAHLPNVSFAGVDICDRQALSTLFAEEKPDWIFHFAAESHVDNSIKAPEAFLLTNVMGTFNLLQCARETWTDFEGKLFHHVSTDEVFGSLTEEGYFTETTPYDPSSPYSASKASSDHIVRAYARTFHIPVKLTNCSNNYGPRQFPEKLIPLMISRAVSGQPLPVYGTGTNVRDWLFVDDHCIAIMKVAQEGKLGETYVVGGGNELSNLDVVHQICEVLATKLSVPKEQLTGLIKFVEDRAGHDFRYAIDFAKIKNELGWSPSVSFKEGLEKTIDWYLANGEWSKAISSGDYRQVKSLEDVKGV